MPAYNQIYLEDAMHNMGVMTDFAVNNAGCPAGQFWDRFLVSSVSRRFAIGAVDIVAGHSGIELARMVFKETGLTLMEINPVISISSREYWAGLVLAKYQWNHDLSFSALKDAKLGLDDVIPLFHPFHEADYTVFEATADRIFQKNKPAKNAWLKEARKNCGLTQEELSFRSNVPLRLIRAYEQGVIDTDKAEYATIVRLRRALHYFDF